MSFTNLLRNEQGATAIEYGLIASLIAIALVTSMQTLGNEVFEQFDGVATDLDDAQRP